MAEERERSVQVSGRGQVAVKPDLGHIRAAIVHQERTPEGAMSVANRAVTSVLEALERAGIARDDITLGRYSVDSVSDYVEGRRIDRGYRITHSLTITVREIERTGEVLAIAVNAGANEISGVRFSVENPTPHIDRARELAFEDARHKADELARLAGVSLGPVISIMETSYEPVPVERFERGMLAMKAMGTSAEPVPIDPEDTEFSVSVSVTWSLA